MAIRGKGRTTQPAHLARLEAIEQQQIAAAGAENDAHARLTMASARERSLAGERAEAFRLKATGHEGADEILERIEADLAANAQQKARAIDERRGAVDAGARLARERMEFIAAHADKFLQDAERATQEAIDARERAHAAFTEAGTAWGAAMAAWSEVNTALGVASGGRGRPFHTLPPSPFANEAEYAMSQLMQTPPPRGRLASVEIGDDGIRRSSIDPRLTEPAARPHRDEAVAALLREARTA